MATIRRQRRPTHPGELLREDIFPALGVSQGEFADVLGVSRRTVNEVLLEKRPVTVDMALRLARAVGGSPGLWLRMQMAVDIWDAEREHADTYAQIGRLPGAPPPGALEGRAEG